MSATRAKVKKSSRIFIYVSLLNHIKLDLFMKSGSLMPTLSENALGRIALKVFIRWDWQIVALLAASLHEGSNCPEAGRFIRTTPDHTYRQ